MNGEANGQFKVVTVDVDAEADLASKYGISHIPPLLIFKNGEVSERIVGMKSKKDLLEAVAR